MQLLNTINSAWAKHFDAVWSKRCCAAEGRDCLYISNSYQSIHPNTNKMSAEQVPRSKTHPIQPIPVHLRIPKRWVLAKRRNGVQQQLHNETIENQYHRILAKAKQLLKSQGGMYFERDYKHDNTENAFLLHAFISDSFYFTLECSMSFVYQCEYAFNNCLHEVAIRKQLSTYTLSQHAKEVDLQPTFKTFYQTVITVQDKRYLYSL